MSEMSEMDNVDYGLGLYDYDDSGEIVGNMYIVISQDRYNAPYTLEVRCDDGEYRKDDDRLVARCENVPNWILVTADLVKRLGCQYAIVQYTRQYFDVFYACTAGTMGDARDVIQQIFEHYGYHEDQIEF